MAKAAMILTNTNADLRHVTIFGNNGAGLRSFSFSGTDSLVFTNTIVSGNTGADCDFLASAPVVTRNGANLGSDGSCSFSVDKVAAGLGPLQDNGGPTETHEPQRGSPAID